MKISRTGSPVEPAGQIQLMTGASWQSGMRITPDFNYGEFAIIKSQAGLNSYKISVKEWVEKTHAIGLQATAGRYGGTYTPLDIWDISCGEPGETIELPEMRGEHHGKR
ncbi:MAG: hypothetical protein Q8N74_04335 [Sulfuricella sp.]|nr:hypothetical protein [Sulfuricella sp.]